MKPNFQFNKLHVELMLRTWKNEKILFSDYLKLLSEIGIKKEDLCLPKETSQKGLWRIYYIKNSESKEDIIGSEISKLFKYLVIERKNSNDYLVAVTPSSHFQKWLWMRNRSMNQRDMIPNKISDPVLQRIEEISELFNRHKKAFEGKTISGKEFISFLFENNISPLIWFWDYRDRRNSGNYSTVLSSNNSSFYLPFSFSLRVERAAKETFSKARSLAGRSIVSVKF